MERNCPFKKKTLWFVSTRLGTMFHVKKLLKISRKNSKSRSSNRRSAVSRDESGLDASALSPLFNAVPGSTGRKRGSRRRNETHEGWTSDNVHDTITGQEEEADTKTRRHTHALPRALSTPDSSPDGLSQGRTDSRRRKTRRNQIQMQEWLVHSCFFALLLHGQHPLLT